MDLSNQKSRFLFAAVIMAASLTILFSAQQAKAESPYIQNVFFGQDEQGDYVSFDWVGVPERTDIGGTWWSCQRDVVEIWLNRFNPDGTTQGMRFSSYWPEGDFIPRNAYYSGGGYSGFGNYGFASGLPLYDCAINDPNLSTELPKHIKTYINPNWSPERLSFTSEDFITIQIVGLRINAQYAELLVHDPEEYHYQVLANPLPVMPYTNVSFGFDKNDLLKVSFDWVGPSRNILPLVGFNGKIHYPFTAHFDPDSKKDVSMNWEDGHNENLFNVSWFGGLTAQKGQHYDLFVQELHKWTPSNELRVCNWFYPCPVNRTLTESFLGRNFESNDYITIAFYSNGYVLNDPNKYYFRLTSQNHQPTLSELGQFDGATSIPEGWILRHPYISSFSANVNDPDGDRVRLQVELRRFEESFTGIDDGGILTSDPVDPVSSGWNARVPEMRDGVRPAIQLSGGKYHWRARALDATGNESEWQEFGSAGNIDFEILTNQPPVASFTFSPQNPKAGETITFDASGTYDPDPDGQIVRYEWDWDGDGVYDDSLESATVSMQYPLGGSFMVRLRVIDNSGAEAVFSAPLVVSDTSKSELSAFIIFAFRDAGNTHLWQNIAFDTPVIKYLFPSYRNFQRIDEWLREDAIGNISGKELDWFRNDQRFNEFSCIELADIITLLHEKIPSTDVSYESRILTTISEYRMADYALLSWQNNALGLKQAGGIFNEIGAQIVKFVPIVGELIVGDSTVSREILKETVKTGTKVAAAEVLIRSGFAQEVAEDMSKFGVNIAWTAYKVYKGIGQLNDLAKSQKYENELAKYFYCLSFSGSADDCWTTARQEDAVLNPVLEEDDKQEFQEMWQNYSPAFSAAGVSQAKLEELQNVVKAMILDALEQNKSKLPNRLCINPHSPIEIRVLNSDGAVTGMVDGKIKNEIAYSVYDPEKERVTIVSPSGNYSFLAVGNNTATYGLTIQFLNNGTVDSFIASDIMTSPGAVHQYNIDWQAVSRGEKGVTIKVDQNGDGIFEYQFIAGAILEDKIAPTTALSLSGASGLNGWYVSDVMATLIAQDNEDGVGVLKTEYSLDNGITWNTYINPFSISKERINSILYRSQDFLNNLEDVKIAEVKIDKTPPEAKVYFDKDIKTLKVEGIDNLTPNPIISVTKQESQDQDGNNNTENKKQDGEKIIYQIRDDAGHTLKLTFKKIKQEGKEIKAVLENAQYDDQQIIQLPITALNYEWSIYKENQKIKELNQKIKIENQFNIEANYNFKKDETKITIEFGKDDNNQNKEENKHEQEQTIAGLVIIKLTTKSGSLGYEF